MEKRGERRGGDGVTRLKEELFKTIAAAEMVKKKIQFFKMKAP